MTRPRILTIILGFFALCSSLPAFSASIHEVVRTGVTQEVSKMITANRTLVNAKNELGSTPLHIAAGNTAPDVAKLLIDKGANVNAKDNNGSTPLHLAAFTGHKENVNLLLAKGADVNAKDNKGKTARDYADAVLNREIADMLLIKMLATPGPAPKK